MEGGSGLAGMPSNSGNPMPNVSQAEFLQFLDQYSDADSVVREAVDARNKVRAAVKAAGIPLPAFDRVRKDMAKSGAVRELEDAAHRRMMAWLARPVGFQASMDIANDPAIDPGTRALQLHEIKRIQQEGFAAGKTGDRADRNPYTPGTEGFVHWHNSWLKGQEEKVGTLGSDPAPSPAANGGKRRGRPRKGSEEPPAGSTIQ